MGLFSVSPPAWARDFSPHLENVTGREGTLYSWFLITASCNAAHTHLITGQALLDADSTWMGNLPNDKYEGCCWRVYPDFVARKGVEENTQQSYSNLPAKHIA
jgi:hypothetical protein